MTRKWDPEIGQFRDSGKFGGNDNVAAAGGLNALASPAPTENPLTHPDRPADRREQRGSQWIQIWDNDDGGHMVLHEFSKEVSWHDSNGLIHRDGDLPAIVGGDGKQVYMIKDLMHRNPADGPAVVNADGTTEWYEFGMKLDAPSRDFMSRNDAPATPPPNNPELGSSLVESQRRRRGHNFYPPKAVRTKVPPMYSTENIPVQDKTIGLKYFAGPATIYVAEADWQSGEVFCYTDLGHGGEWGYQDLGSLESLQIGNFRQPLERDLSWEPTKAGNII